MKMLNRSFLSPAVISALAAAILFGASTPIAKYFIGGNSPILIAGLLYSGSGIGLMLIKIIRDRGWKKPQLTKSEYGWLAGAIFFGGILAPVLLMYGLSQTSSASASLLLNLEAVLTSVIAWVVFRENADRRIVVGMILIVFGGLILSLPHGGTSKSDGVLGILAIVAACLCWAIDNNLTRKVSASDSFFIAGSKGLVAGVVNISLALWLCSSMPHTMMIAIILLCGFLGYGLSLLLFILALRGLGTSRTGAYFSVAPFIGAAIAIVIFNESVNLLFWLALLFMAIGVWMHLTEIHEHEHTHDEEFHEHYHIHDEHHQHEHDFVLHNKSGHTHPHQHDRMSHSHHHYPDVNHLHRH